MIFSRDKSLIFINNLNNEHPTENSNDISPITTDEKTQNRNGTESRREQKRNAIFNGIYVGNNVRRIYVHKV